MEILDIVDENGVPTGDTVSREEAHEKGIRHRTSHVWLMRVNAKACGAGYGILDGVELLVQRRRDDKDSHPGCLDISSAGHIPSGCSYVESALRELREELGVTASAKELHFCGKRRKAYSKNFHGSIFSDNQVSNVYVMYRDIPEEDIVFQRSEISEVFWMPFNEVYDMVFKDENGEEKPRSCIALEEMQMLRNYLCDHMDVLIGKLA